MSNLDLDGFYKYLEKDNIKIYEELKADKLELSTVLEVLRDGQLTLAGNLIFGNDPQRFTKSFYVDCCYFDGDDISVDSYISKKVIKGNITKTYEECLNFLKSNQSQKDFNSSAVLEIDERVLTELIVNALVHRDYHINSSIKVFIFHNRVEIISPGKLYNSLTVEKIKNGLSILNSICKNILPYSGYGSGIKRALSIEFINDTEKEEFKCVIKRKGEV